MDNIVVIKRRRREEEFQKAVSITVWVCWKAVVTEKTIKEKSTNKSNFNDNYSYIASASRQYLPFFKHPNLFVKSAVNNFLINDLALRSKNRGKLILPAKICW